MQLTKSVSEIYVPEINGGFKWAAAPPPLTECILKQVIFFAQNALFYFCIKFQRIFRGAPDVTPTFPASAPYSKLMDPSLPEILSKTQT